MTDAAVRRNARVAGGAFVAAIAIVIMANYGISFRLIVPSNAAETARNIVAHEALFRLNIACDLLYAATLLVLVTTLYHTLESVNGSVALLAAICRGIVAVMWGLTALNSLGALRLLGDTAYLSAFTSPQLQTLARVDLATAYDAYYTGLPFWALASTLCSYLWFKSRFIPRPLAVFGLVASGWGVFCAFMFIAIPHFPDRVGASWFDTPLILFEMVLGLWLSIKGIRNTSVAS
jgi:hypothetical protein